MTDINDVEKYVYEIASKFAFIEKVETLLKTPIPSKLSFLLHPLVSSKYTRIFRKTLKVMLLYLAIKGYLAGIVTVEHGIVIH